jgi:hypothetical protein
MHQVEGDRRPAGLIFFRLPTLRNFNEFILAMDKLLSDNLDQSFFKGAVSLEVETTRNDGKVIVRPKGTLSLLEEWLDIQFTWGNADVPRITEPLRRVRKLRQKPAHTFEEDTYSDDYERQQHEILHEIYESMAQLRGTLMQHRDAPTIKIPSFLAERNIVFY